MMKIHNGRDDRQNTRIGDQARKSRYTLMERGSIIAPSPARRMGRTGHCCPVIRAKSKGHRRIAPGYQRVRVSKTVQIRQPKPILVNTLRSTASSLFHYLINIPSFAWLKAAYRILYRVLFGPRVCRTSFASCFTKAVLVKWRFV